MSGWRRGFLAARNEVNELASSSSGSSAEQATALPASTSSSFTFSRPIGFGRPLVTKDKVASRVMGEIALCGYIAEYLDHKDAIQLEAIAVAMYLPDDYFGKAYSRELVYACEGQCTWKVKVWETNNNSEADWGKAGATGESAMRRAAMQAPVLLPHKRRQVYSTYRQIASLISQARRSQTREQGSRLDLTGFRSDAAKYLLTMRVLGASSCDRVEESPQNLLKESTCFLLIDSNLSFPVMSAPRQSQYGMSCQLRCRCIDRHPCYWSSRPSRQQNLREWIDFDVESPGKLNIAPCMLSHIRVRAYRSWGQPEAPIYAPQEIQVELIAPKPDGGEVVYYTESFPFLHSDQNQTFVLKNPVPIFPQFPSPSSGATGELLSPKIRLRCNGAYQRQTVDALDVGQGLFIDHGALEDLNGYFVCLSRVAFYGTSMRSVNDNNINDIFDSTLGRCRYRVQAFQVSAHRDSSDIVSPPASSRSRIENPYASARELAVGALAAAGTDAGDGGEAWSASAPVQMQLDWYLTTQELDAVRE